MRGKVLILAGTSEARQVCAALGGLNVLASLAGLTAAPTPLGVPTRIGGFGGAAGFASALDDVSAVLNAVHPFASGMTDRTARICAERQVPYLRLTRPAWGGLEGCRHYKSAEEAAASVPDGARAFLAVGPGSVGPFLGRGRTLWCRRIDEAAPVEGLTWVVGRPPFTQAAEAALFAQLGITDLVTKNSGGPRAKLDAAAQLGIAVHVIDRPAAASGEETHDIRHAIDFVRSHASPLPDHSG